MKSAGGSCDSESEGKFGGEAVVDNIQGVADILEDEEEYSKNKKTAGDKCIYNTVEAKGYESKRYY